MSGRGKGSVFKHPDIVEQERQQDEARSRRAEAWDTIRRDRKRAEYEENEALKRDAQASISDDEDTPLDVTLTKMRKVNAAAQELARRTAASLAIQEAKRLARNENARKNRVRNKELHRMMNEVEIPSQMEYRGPSAAAASSSSQNVQGFDPNSEPSRM